MRYDYEINKKSDRMDIDIYRGDASHSQHINMIQTRVKGNRNVRRAIEDLEGQGYLVDKVEKTGKFQTQKDLFGLFDLVAMHPKKYATFIQVTSNTPHTHRDFMEFSEHYPESFYEQWVWIDRRGWKKFAYILGKKYILDKPKTIKG